MTPPVNYTPSQGFEILRALQRGGLSLWLNRMSLLPMCLIPTVVTFLTIMVMRAWIPQYNPSLFLLSLIQIPSDFVTGLLCALVIYIIINAPRKSDKDKPVLFVLNLTERKDLLVAAAGLHTVFGYFAGGFYALANMIVEPMQKALDSGADPAQVLTGDKMILIAILLVAAFYGVRFVFLPILIMSRLDIRDFFMKNKSIGFSLPVLIIKMVTAMAAGFVLLFATALFAVPQTEGQAYEDLPLAVQAIIDFIAAFASVVASVWAYASLTVGFRQMTERDIKA